MMTHASDESPNDDSDRTRLRMRIRDAFEGVSLGDGVGLYQAQGIDDHDSAEVCQSLRLGDEKNDWQRITIEDLNRCYSSLSFFDAAGMRFHLPAFLLAEIDGAYKFDLAMDFIDMSDHKMQQYSLFTVQQKGAIGDYLRFIQDQPGHWLDVYKIDFALECYWDIDPGLLKLKNI
jgi:hypothetical protein